ncbi:DUF2000 domain-containing protein [Deinococcus oregonensis]|uniref:DUF2000 domain-containing protein n=1 Tax=Deinococcus oregonensis TaxID=1805970 RepID=A0ABV6AVT9_9DEIO
MNDDARLVIIVDPALTLGVIANTCALLAVSLGQQVSEHIGPDLPDASGELHAGLFDRAITVLAAAAAELPGLRRRAKQTGLLTVDFTTLPQRARTYDEYASALSAASPEALDYLGLALYGPGKAVRRVTGSLPLLKGVV